MTIQIETRMTNFEKNKVNFEITVNGISESFVCSDLPDLETSDLSQLWCFPLSTIAHLIGASGKAQVTIHGSVPADVLIQFGRIARWQRSMLLNILDLDIPPVDIEWRTLNTVHEQTWDVDQTFGGLATSGYQSVVPCSGGKESLAVYGISEKILGYKTLTAMVKWNTQAWSKGSKSMLRDHYPAEGIPVTSMWTNFNRVKKLFNEVVSYMGHPIEDTKTGNHISAFRALTVTNYHFIQHNFFNMVARKTGAEYVMPGDAYGWECYQDGADGFYPRLLGLPQMVNTHKAWTIINKACNTPAVMATPLSVLDDYAAFFILDHFWGPQFEHLEKKETFGKIVSSCLTMIPSEVGLRHCGKCDKCLMNWFLYRATGNHPYQYGFDEEAFTKRHDYFKTGNRNDAIYIDDDDWEMFQRGQIEGHYNPNMWKHLPLSWVWNMHDAILRVKRIREIRPGEWFDKRYPVYRWNEGWAQRRRDGTWKKLPNHWRN
jgi:hypothetical protein